MRSMLRFALSLALLLVCAASSALAQAVPAATKTEPPWAIGVGVSGYNLDWAQSNLYGGTLWIDYMPNRIPPFLHGLGVELEARDLNYGRPSSQPNLREDVAGGGLIYSWRRYRNLRPYGKLLVGYGNLDYGVRGRYHDSRNLTTIGGGVEFRVARCVWARADYEYLFWPDMVFKNNKPIAGINPQGFTAGVLYHFNRPHFR
jgi:opacity protein-like surface antigen